MKLKNPTAFLAALLLMASANAQLKIPALNSIRTDIQKVVADYPSQFSSLKGDVIATNPQTVEYRSLVFPDKAESSVITHYSSNTHQVYSWQAVMLSTEDFDEAVKKYKWLFTQLKGMNVKYVVDQYTLQGTYAAPAEERKFTVSELSIVRPPQALKKLRVDISMQFEFPEWKVSLLVYEKEREDDEQFADGD